MPEARDRLSRPTDYGDAYQRRRSHGVLVDEPDSIASASGSPAPRWPPATTEVSTRFQVGWGSVLRQNRRGRFGRGRYPHTSPSGRENTPIGSSRRRRVPGVNRTLPSWYPRTPLRDITAIVRAIERRRARLGDIYDREIEPPAPQQADVLDSPLPVSGAQLEHTDLSMVTPRLAVKTHSDAPSTSKVHKMLLDITNQNQEESELLTPPKKLLKSIDKVEKVVTEEIEKLNSTPSAKRAERAKKVKTLMSMR